MTKKILSLVALTMLLVLASCSKKQNLLQYVPEDAQMAAKVEVGDMLKSADCKWDAKDGLQLSDELKQALGDRDLLKEMDLPEGLDLSEDIVLFAQSQTDAFAYVAVIADTPKFEAAMKERGAEAGEKNGTKLFTSGRQIVAYDDNVAVFYTQSRGGVEYGEPDDNAIAILKKPAKNIEGNKDAMKYLGKGGHITVYANVATAMKTLGGMTGDLGGAGMAMGFLGDIYKSCGASINYDGKKVVTEGAADINTESSSYKMIKDVLKPVSSADALKYIPADASGVITLGIDGKKLAEALTPLVNQYGPMIGADKSLLDELSGIDGTVAIGVRYSESQQVNFYAAIGSKDAGKLLAFLKKSYLGMAGGSIQESEQGSVIDLGSTKVILKAEGNYLLVCNAPLTGGNAEKGAIADNAKGAMLSMYYTTGAEGSAAAKMSESFLGKPLIGTQTVRIESLDKAGSVLTIEKPEGKNSLASLLKLIFAKK